MALLPGVLGCRPLQLTVQVRLGTNTLRLPGGPPASPERAGSRWRGGAVEREEVVVFVAEAFS